MLKHIIAALIATATYSINAGQARSGSLPPDVVDRLLEIGGWTTTAADTNQREQLTVDLAKRLVEDYPSDTRTVGLLTLTLGAAKWGVRNDPSLPADPARDGWRGPTRASGKHLMSYLVGGVGLPHLDVASLSRFIDFLLVNHPDIGGATDQAYMRQLAGKLRTGTKYDQVKSNATFRNWMLEGLRHKDAQEWILNDWLDTYWTPAYRASNGDIRLALVLARIWNTSPGLGRCAAEHALQSDDRLQAALLAYTNCAGGNQDYRTRRWGWMKRPVVVFDAYAKRIPG
ncbi:hypothetical protein ELI20_36965 [Rhizobium ruizarguesonis]|uniref:hypothetical protein n=1 Tax=Rhizobium ruizarguesonis TaxID=2081791 RepID=UPI001031BE75|nr:hypothetical protein [Rhizobium ruizarguesonis]TAW04058.1 hypothetical protein ELI20_36965 [Rhizobium ruizarguesonis]